MHYWQHTMCLMRIHQGAPVVLMKTLPLLHSTFQRASGVVIELVEECCFWSPALWRRHTGFFFFQLFTKACLGSSADIIWILCLSLLPSEATISTGVRRLMVLNLQKLRLEKQGLFLRTCEKTDFSAACWRSFWSLPLCFTFAAKGQTQVFSLRLFDVCMFVAPTSEILYWRRRLDLSSWINNINHCSLSRLSWLIIS